MAVNGQSDSLNGLFKKVYADEVENLIPDNVKIAKMVPFVKQNKRNGESYQQAVILKSEHGVTYGGTGGDTFSYNPAVPGATKQASILPAEMVLRSQISRGALSRSENLTEGAFANATKHVIENMLQSMFTKYEAQCFYGGVGLATVGSVNGTEIEILLAEWAPGIFVGGEGMQLNVYNAALDTLRSGTAVITAVDLLNNKITVDALPAGTVASDIIFELGAKGNEFIGIHSMLSTVSGTVFGLNTASYSLWRANSSAVGGALTFAKVSAGIAGAVAKGVVGKLDLFINPRTWSNLLTEQTAQRTFHEGGVSEYANGAESIVFHSQNGKIEIHASSFVKESYAYALDMSCFMRIGSKDISFDDPTRPGQYIENLTESNAYQVLGYTDSALFCSAIGRQILFTDIVNS